MGPPLLHIFNRLWVVNILCEPRVLLFQVTRADLNSIQLHIQADGTADWLQRVVLSTLDVAWSKLCSDSATPTRQFFSEECEGRLEQALKERFKIKITPYMYKSTPIGGSTHTFLLHEMKLCGA